MTTHRPLPKLLQLVPPGGGGVRDHAQRLQDAWQRAGVASDLDDLSKAGITERPLASRVSALRGTDRAPCALLVHFSGYGYGARGLCFWLLSELEAARSLHGKSLRIVVLFHEIYATGPPWRSAFWVSPAQVLIATRLARLADALATNTDHHAAWLRGVVGGRRELLVRPVFSNVGEGDAQPRAMQRVAQAVVFGLASTRQRALDGLRGQTQALRGMGIGSLVEVGGGETDAAALDGFPLRRLGRLEAPALSSLLRQSRFGVLSHASHSLGKSGVFAAYASHGCVPIDTCAPGRDADGLVAGRDYLHLSRPASGVGFDADFDAVSASAARWYATHSLARQAQEFLALVGGLNSAEVGAAGGAAVGARGG